MSQETTENVNTQEENNENSNTQNESNQPKSYTQEEVDKILKDRLYQKEMENKRKNEKTMKRLEELEAKEKAGTATNSERMELSAGKTAQANAQQAGIPPEAIPYITDEKMAAQQYRDKLMKAADNDPEFKKLASDDKSLRMVSHDQQFFIRDLENAPAVLKKLLTDKKENNLMQAKFQEAIAHGKPSIMVEYINNLSEKLEKSAIKPRASSYTPDADIGDFGDSSQDFDLKKYVSNYRQ